MKFNQSTMKIRALAGFLTLSIALSPMTSYAASYSGAKEGTNQTNVTSVVGDLTDHDIHDKNAVGSLTIHKYDMTSAEKDGITFGWSDTDHNSDGTDSTLTTKDGQNVNITSTGKENANAENALKEYAIKGVEFTYLRVGDVKTLSDVNEDGINGDIQLIYGLDTDLMNILRLKPYDPANKGSNVADDGKDDVDNSNRVAVTKIENVNYFTSQQINDAMKESLEMSDAIAKDTLEAYIVNHGGTKFAETDANGETSKSQLPLGLYLIVETAVPENVVDTCNPWFTEIPMTDIDGEAWFYDVECYPKNQTGSPTLDKLVRNADCGIGITDPNKNEDYVYGTTVTASEGDILDYILVTKLPRSTSSATYLKKYELVDTLADGIKYNGDLKIAIYNSETFAKVNDTTQAIDVWTPENTGMYDVDYAQANAKSEGQWRLDITMGTKGLEAINKQYYDGAHYLVAYYTATVESDATTVLGDEGNPNDVTLIWNRTNESYFNTLEDRSIIYTYGIDLTKTFSDQDKKSQSQKENDFKAVEFILYNETEDYYVLAKPSTDTDGLYYVTGKDVSKDKATIFTPGKAGNMVINGLEADQYKLTEVDTAKGYSILQNQIDINITPSSREITPSSVHYMTVANDHDVEHPDTDSNSITLSDGRILIAKEEGTTDKDNMVIGTLTSATATVDGIEADMCAFGEEKIGKAEIDATPNKTVAAASANAAVILSIMNSRTFLLPQTGGAGMYLITILGVVIAIAGVFYLTRKNKKGIC